MRTVRPSSAATPRRSRLRRVGVVATALAAAAAACLGTTAATAGASPAHSGPGFLPRTQIPWSQVGPGWTLAAWAPGVHAKRTTLVLVDRDGRSTYRIASFRRDLELWAWSPNGRKAIVEAGGHNHVVNLGSGKIHLAGRSENIIGFTPNSQGYIRAMQRRSHGQWVTAFVRHEFGTRGSHDYPTDVKGAGALDPYSAVIAADGRLVAGAENGIVVYGRDGESHRHLAGGLGRCTVSDFWRPGVVEAACHGGAVYAVPLSGGHIHKLTGGRGPVNEFGYSDVWRYTDGRLGLAPNGCGPESLVRFDASGHGHRIEVPSPNKMDGTRTVIGHDGDVVTLTLRSIDGCESGRVELYVWDAHYGTTHLLLGGGNDGTVLDALSWSGKGH